MSISSDNHQPTSGSHYQPSLPVVIVILVLFIVAAFAVGGGAPSSTSRAATSQATTTRPSNGSGGATTTVPQRHIAVSQVVVQVANGTQTRGLAKVFTQNLQTLGWGTLSAINGPRVSATVIYYKPAFAWAATLVASQIHVPTTALQPLGNQRPVPGAAGDELVVVLGPDAH